MITNYNGYLMNGKQRHSCTIKGETLRNYVVNFKEPVFVCDNPFYPNKDYLMPISKIIVLDS